MILKQVAQALEEKGIDASFEYPGFIAVKIGARTANFGNVNIDFGADWENGESTCFFMPETATADELTTAITGWISQQILTPVAKDIMNNLLTAMEHAEGMYGPEDYVTLMESIAYEANQRIANYRAWNADERKVYRSHRKDGE